MKKKSSRIEKMLIQIQMWFMKYETRRFFGTHSLNRKRRLQQKKIDTNEVSTCRSFFPPLQSFYQLLLRQLNCFKKAWGEPPSIARSERDALSVFIAYCQHHSGTYLLQAALIIRSLGIRILYYSRIRKQGKIANNKEKKHSFKLFQA